MSDTESRLKELQALKLKLDPRDPNYALKRRRINGRIKNTKLRSAVPKELRQQLMTR